MSVKTHQGYSASFTAMRFMQLLQNVFKRKYKKELSQTPLLLFIINLLSLLNPLPTMTGVRVKSRKTTRRRQGNNEFKMGGGERKKTSELLGGGFPTRGANELSAL